MKDRYEMLKGELGQPLCADNTELGAVSLLAVVWQPHSHSNQWQHVTQLVGIMRIGGGIEQHVVHLVTRHNDSLYVNTVQASCERA